MQGFRNFHSTIVFGQRVETLTQTRRLTKPVEVLASSRSDKLTVMTPLKMLFPLRRLAGVSHDEIVDYWRRVHMPQVIEHMTPIEYSVTFFHQDAHTTFDGLASITYDDHDRGRREQGRQKPDGVALDGFRELVEPPRRSETTEHIIVSGPRPPDAHKVTALVQLRDGDDAEVAWDAWIRVHAPNVAAGFEAAGGLRYVISLADQHRRERPFLGAAELWFGDRASADAHLSAMSPDAFTDLTTTELLHGVEIIGVPATAGTQHS